MFYATHQLRGRTTRRGRARLDLVLSMLCGLGNSLIQHRKEQWEAGARVNFNDQSKLITEIRHLHPEWAKLDTAVCRSPLRRVDKAYSAFFRRLRSGEKPGYPRYKAESRYDCIEIRDVKPSNLRQRPSGELVVKLKGLPKIEMRPRREIDVSTVKAIRIVRRQRGCTVDLVVPHSPEPLPKSDSVVGIDMGVRKRMTLSTGEIVAPAEQNWKPIRRAQRAISRCRKGSWRRRKRVRQLAQIRRRQAVRNRNVCHRITTDLVVKYGVIAVEDLKIKSMTRSVAGTLDAPGNGVIAKRNLNRQIHDQTWGLIRSQLRYKAEWAGRRYVEVDPRYTSRICHKCGIRGDPGSTEHWVCSRCGASHDRDVNAAINILRAGSFALESVTDADVGAVGSEHLRCLT